MSRQTIKRKRRDGKEELMDALLAPDPQEPHPGPLPMHPWESETCYRLRPNPDAVTVDALPGLRGTLEREAPPPFEVPSDLDGRRAAVYEAATRAIWHRREGRAALAAAWQERWAGLLRLLDPHAPGGDFTAAHLSWPERSEARRLEWALCRRLAETEKTEHD
jgi:hypothetical protein